jgi:sodium transport system ATP-binding protein
LYQRLTPLEVLQYFGRLYGLAPDDLHSRIEALVDELEIGAFRDRPCSTLSSGQKQRANIARAFLHDPDLLILDEPTTALDVVSGKFVVDAIRKKRAEGRAVLFSTHIMGEAEYLCDRIVLIHQGRVIDEGPLSALLERSGQENLTDTFLHYVAS